jgi:hypothetical protein
MNSAKSSPQFIIFFAIIFIAQLPFSSNAQIKPPIEDRLVFIQNGKIKLGFDKNTGAFLVFKDLENAFDFLDEKDHYLHSPWQIEMIQSSQLLSIDAKAAAAFQISKQGPLSVLMVWQGLAGVNSLNLQVTVTVTLDKDKALSYWNISIAGLKGEKIKQITFPKVTGIRDSGNEHLVVPGFQEKIIENPKATLIAMKSKEKKYEWRYHGPHSPQFLAFFNAASLGFYTVCDDKMAKTKKITVSLGAPLNDLNCQIDHYPSFDSASGSYTLPCNAIIGSFKGDWKIIAKLYQ